MKKGPGKITDMAFKHLFKKPATIVGPPDAQSVQKGYRGKLIFDPTDCINCKLCVRDCPSNAIKVINEGTKENKKMKIILNMGNCIFCCQCADSCPKNCISYSQRIYLSTFNKDELTGPI